SMKTTAGFRFLIHPESQAERAAASYYFCRTVSTVFIRTKGCRLPLLEKDGEKSPSCEGGSILRSIIESEGQMKLRSPVAQRKAKILLQPGIGKNGIARPPCGRGVLRSRNRHDAADNNR